MNMQPQQDWREVTVRKKPPSAAELRSSAALNAALRSGDVTVEARNRGVGGGGGGGGPSGAVAAKMDAETEDFHHARLSSGVRANIVAARAARKMTQAQLAQAMNVRPQVVQEYENGKAIPDARTLDRMARALGVPSLRR